MKHKALLAGLLLTSAFSNSALAASSASSITNDSCNDGKLSGIACNIRTEFGEFGALIVAAFYLLGFFLTGLGVYFFWKNEQQPNQDHGKKGLVAIFVGGGLLSITYLVDASSGTVSGKDVDTGSKIDAELGGEY